MFLFFFSFPIYFWFLSEDDDEYSYYCCLEDETPLLVSEKCDVDVKDLVAVNIDMLPSLQKNSKLRNGTFSFSYYFTIIHVLYNMDFTRTNFVEN